MASGDALCVFRAMDNEPPDADYATLDTVLTTSADEPDDVVPVLDFDPGATNEFAAFSAVMPEHYAGGGLTVTVIWMSESTGSENVKWDAAFKSFTSETDNVGSKSYATIQTVTAANNTTSRVISFDDIAFTDGAQMDSIAKNEYFRFTIERDSADAADTMNSNDAELIAIYITET